LFREKRSTWTVRGWKEKDKEGKEIMVGEEIPTDKEQESPNCEQGKEMLTEKTDENDVEMNDDVDKVFEKEIAMEMKDVLKTSWSAKGRDAVRDVFKRACVVHCPNKAMIRFVDTL
jgi:hypothetical protein